VADRARDVADPKETTPRLPPMIEPHGVRELALHAPILRDDFDPESWMGGRDGH